MQYNVSSPQTRFYNFLHYYRDSQLMFFSLGNYLTHNGYWVNERHDGWTWKDGKHLENRQNCAYRWWDLKSLVNVTNPCTCASKLNFHPFYLQK